MPTSCPRLDRLLQGGMVLDALLILENCLVSVLSSPDRMLKHGVSVISDIAWQTIPMPFKGPLLYHMARLKLLLQGTRYAWFAIAGRSHLVPLTFALNPPILVKTSGRPA
ncbi:hypothetical protein AVEN_93385-1 [Araneus ventricosus]|uniref:Uncharacterized protein n=1 Tax=Araneus ventricosus TaxID=182803 RepID=A0A4Y2AQV9_ARAVE|nr:hypothetical protein AVEN_93385-1 [Araneus ventricosus]